MASSCVADPVFLMQLIILLVFSCAIAQGSHLQKEWEHWKLKYSKNYTDSADEEASKIVWIENYNRIADHTQANESFHIALNQFSDLTEEEYKNQFLSEIKITGMPVTSRIKHLLKNATSVQTLDWRKRGFVSEVSEQGSICKSSWAFSAVGALEGLNRKLRGKLLSLSVQQLVDCSEKYGNNGCEGGTVKNAFKYVQEEGGICSESEYPYIGYGWQCVSRFCKKKATCLSYVDVSTGNEKELMNAVYTLGPVSVMVDATSYSFQFYKAGIYYSNSCSQQFLNQAMLVVGYGRDSVTNEKYWILKNSWGTCWGENGYMRLARNRNNTCGIASLATYPVVIYT